jgi:hypothetical protein
MQPFGLEGTNRCMGAHTVTDPEVLAEINEMIKNGNVGHEKWPTVPIKRRSYDLRPLLRLHQPAGKLRAFVSHPHQTDRIA